MPLSALQLSFYILLAVLPFAVNAVHYAAGTSRYNFGSDRPTGSDETHFSLAKLTTTIEAITDTLYSGSNRTLGARALTERATLPVSKIYGVNVSEHAADLYFKKDITDTRS